MSSIYNTILDCERIIYPHFILVMQTRYRNLNLARKLHPEVMERLYLKDDSALVPSSPSAMKSSWQKQETVPEIPVRTNKEV